jgi:transcriptional regulator with XRE-family HTH domain
MLQRQLAAALEIETPMYSKIERGKRQAKRKQAIAAAKIFKANPKGSLILWLANKIIVAIGIEAALATKH